MAPVQYSKGMPCPRAPFAWLLLFLVLAGMMIVACQKKKLDINVKQIDCKNLKISNATYSLPYNPCNVTTAAITQTVTLRFEHNNKKDCLDFLHLSANFRDVNGAIIDGVQYQTDYTSTDPALTVTDAYLELRMTYTMASQSDADKLRSIDLELYSLNALNAESNKLKLVVSLACNNTVAGLNYSVVRNVTVSSSNITLGFNDYSAEDGDIIDVYLNGNKVISSLTLKNAVQLFDFTINSGTNTLVVIALNEGSSSPNTTQITVNNGSGIKMTPGLSTGQAIQIQF
jgi:hypothetical protein